MVLNCRDMTNATQDQKENAIPDGWTETSLEQASERMFSGGTPSTKRADFYGGDIPWIRTQEVNFNYLHNAAIKITEEGLNNSSAKWVPEEAVIIAMYGNSAGRTAYTKIRATTNQACCNFVADPSVADSRFVFQNLRWRYREIEGKANGAAQQNLSVGVLKELPIILPPLAEQVAIADLLSSFDNKIELLREQNKTLEEIAQTIFKEWFGKYSVDRPEELPDGWRFTSLSSVADFLNGLALQKFPPRNDDTDLPVIKIRELKQGITGQTSQANSKLDSKYVIDNGDVIFSWSGSLEVVIWHHGRGALNQHLFKVTSQVYPKWFYYFWLLQHLREFRGVAKGKSTTMGHINRKHLDAAQVIIPGKSELRELDMLIAPMLKKIERNSSQIQSLTRLRDVSLPKLMSGEVRVI